jgi:uncharacterized protein
MKLHAAHAEGRNLFSGYGPGYVAINGVRHERSLVVLADRILDWDVGSFDSLNAAAFSALAELPLEILVLGTGAVLRFPDASYSKILRGAGIGLEIMDTRAACRTYNILLSEDRRVGAALLMAPRS